MLVKVGPVAMAGKFKHSYSCRYLRNENDILHKRSVTVAVTTLSSMPSADEMQSNFYNNTIGRPIYYLSLSMYLEH